jgi:hypothetical protein
MTQYRMSLVVSLYKQNKKDPKYTLIISLLHLVRHHLQQQKNDTFIIFVDCYNLLTFDNT